MRYEYNILIVHWEGGLDNVIWDKSMVLFRQALFRLAELILIEDHKTVKLEAYVEILWLGISQNYIYEVWG